MSSSRNETVHKVRAVVGIAKVPVFQTQWDVSDRVEFQCGLVCADYMSISDASFLVQEGGV